MAAHAVTPAVCEGLRQERLHREPSLGLRELLAPVQSEFPGTVIKHVEQGAADVAQHSPVSPIPSSESQNTILHRGLLRPQATSPPEFLPRPLGSPCEGGPWP